MTVRRRGSPRRLAAGLAGVSVALGLLALWLPAWREFLIVSGLALLALAGGVLNWDRRSGH